MAKIILFLITFIIFFATNTVHVRASFNFSAVGDFAATNDTTGVLNGIKSSSTPFTLALGDLSYDQLTPESAWCNYVKNIVGSDYPFELVAGNHEEDGELGHINNFANCLPDKLGNINGTYSKQYYFDYLNLARFIVVSPDLTLDGEYYNYNTGTPRHQWLVDTIDSARNSGIKWIIVGMHKYCLNLEDSDCLVGEDLTNLLIEKNVDLVLQGHAHNYQRSKQLSLDNPNCTAVVHESYNSSCVSGDGYDGLYKKDNGTVFMIVGTGGRNLSFIDNNDKEKPYFTSWSAGNSNPSFGFAKLTVTDTTLSSQFITTSSNSSYTDSFSIVPPEAYSNQYKLIETYSEWKYLDNGSNQGTNWRESSYDDGFWKSGLAQLGYGDGDEATVTNNNIVTTYFRKKFDVVDPSQINSLTLNLIRDDGAIVYINGNEVVRTNMPSGDISYDTLATDFASSPEENYYTTFTLSKDVLVQGENIIAVEIHQASIDSIDMSFNLGLSTTTSTPPASPTPTLPVTPPIPPSNTPTPTPIPTVSDITLVQKRSSWKHLDNGTDQGTSWRNTTFNDSSWKTGLGELGFGDGDESTVTNNNIITTYFRKNFDVVDVAKVTSLAVNLVRDDGAVVYINGTEVIRTNMPSGSISYNTLSSGFASPPEENYYNNFPIPVGSLVNGTNTIAVEIHQAAQDSIDMSFDLELIASVLGAVSPTPTITPTPTVSITPTPSPTTQNLQLITKNSYWKYLDDGSNQGTSWRDFVFDDSQWKSGQGQLGYGDGDEQTVIKSNTTDYFRKDFTVSDPNQISSLTLNLVRDDGAIVYINGTEVLRTNMPSGGVTYTTMANNYANSPEENYYNTFNVASSSLIAGQNSIAVEVHQALGSSDISFDLELIAKINAGETTPTPIISPTPTPLPSITNTPTPTLTPTPTPLLSITPTPTPILVKQSLITKYSTWKYLDNGVDQGTNWKDALFNDSSWKSGSGQLGYGDGDEATVIQVRQTNYFRKSFDVDDKNQVSQLTLNLVRDDGAIVYINGNEVFRTNMPDGTINYSTLANIYANSPEENYYNSFSIPTSALVSGDNVMAVEVHQGVGSLDISFDVELVAN